MFEEEERSHQCVDCKAYSPKMSEGDTFLSVQHGWRLHRRTNAVGEILFEWRCSECWQRYKSQRPASGERHAIEDEIPSSRQTPSERSSGRYSVVVAPRGRKV